MGVNSGRGLFAIECDCRAFGDDDDPENNHLKYLLSRISVGVCVWFQNYFFFHFPLTNVSLIENTYSSLQHQQFEWFVVVVADDELILVTKTFLLPYGLILNIFI